MKDRPAWLALAHESDEIVKELTPDLFSFYQGFDGYMKAKIKQKEAVMAVDTASEGCLGVVAFSISNNLIYFLGVTKDADFQTVGTELLEIALSKLGKKKEIAVNILRSDLEPIMGERSLYEAFGFVERDNTIFEAGVPACLMIKLP